MIYDKTSVGTVRQIAVTKEDNDILMGYIKKPRDVEPVDSRNYPPAALTSSETEEWYTPSHVIDLVTEVIGSIDLDPASCAEASERVQAKFYFTKEDNGLLLRWSAKTVFLNPPFGKSGNESLAGIWLNKMLKEYVDGNFDSGIALTHTRPGYEWYESMIRKVPICQTREKISFISSTGKKGSGSKTSQTFFYFGSDYDRFYRVFSTLGRVIHPDLCP